MPEGIVSEPRLPKVKGTLAMPTLKPAGKGVFTEIHDLDDDKTSDASMSTSPTSWVPQFAILMSGTIHKSLKRHSTTQKISGGLSPTIPSMSLKY